MPLPTLKPQEIPFDHPDSNNMFVPGPDKPLVATPAAIEMYSHEVIMACWQLLRELAQKHSGLDYLQVFRSDEHDSDLWFLEDGPGGAISAIRGDLCGGHTLDLMADHLPIAISRTVYALQTAGGIANSVVLLTLWRVVSCVQPRH